MRTWIRVVFLLAGCVLGAGYVVTGNVARPERQLPAQASVSWTRTGDLVASPARNRIAAGELLPGKRDGAIRGTMSLRNPTDVTMSARPRAVGRPGELDELVLVRITAQGEPVFEGSLGLLRRLHARPFAIASGAAARVRVSATLAGGAPARRYAGRTARIELEWRTAPVRGGG